MVPQFIETDSGSVIPETLHKQDALCLKEKDVEGGLRAKIAHLTAQLFALINQVAVREEAVPGETHTQSQCRNLPSDYSRQSLH